MSLALAAYWLSLCPYTQLPLCACFLFTSVALYQVIREVWVKACPLSALHSSVTVLSKHKGKSTSAWLKSNTNDILHDASYYKASYKAAIYLIPFNPPNSSLKYFSHCRQMKLRLAVANDLSLFSCKWHHWALNLGFLPSLHYSCLN